MYRVEDKPDATSSLLPTVPLNAWKELLELMFHESQLRAKNLLIVIHLFALLV